MVKVAMSRPETRAPLLNLLGDGPRFGEDGDAGDHEWLSYDQWSELHGNLLKCVKNMVMEPQTLDNMQAGGAISKLVPFLKGGHEQPGAGSGGRDRGGARSGGNLHDVAMLALFYLCRINRGRQEQAARAGIIPHLQRAIRARSNNQHTAVAILCDLPHSSASARSALWEQGSCAFFITLLDKEYWQIDVLRALAEWLGHESSCPALGGAAGDDIGRRLLGEGEQLSVSRVESVLIETRSIQAIVNVFCRSQNFEACLETLLTIVSKSAVMAAAMGNSSLFITEVVHRLTYPKAIVRKNLLMIVKCLYKHHTDRLSMAVDFNLYAIVKQLAKDDRMVRVHAAVVLLHDGGVDDDMVYTCSCFLVLLSYMPWHVCGASPSMCPPLMFFLFLM